MNEIIILGAVFFAVLLVSYTVLRFVMSRREVTRNISSTTRASRQTNEDINKVLGSGNEEIRYYLDVVQNDPPNSIRKRLVQAGFLSKAALRNFNIIRLFVAAGAFALVQFGLGSSLLSIGLYLLLVLAMVAAGMAFILSSAVVEHLGARRSREFRKLFPDFMDLLLVCVDAGLSLNAALDRVTREFLLTTRDFGVQLSIINLEIRAGRPLHEALSNFSQRIDVVEAKTLATLFKQSEELGASVSKTLRVFSHEMREMRLIRAEEKANSLPIKMLFPMAIFMFPVNLVIVLVPIMLVIMKMLSGLSPS